MDWRRAVSVALGLGVAISLMIGVRAAAAQAGPAARPALSSAQCGALATRASSVLRELVAQRDGIGGWPAEVAQLYASAQQIVARLRDAGGARQCQRILEHEERFMALVARMGEWLQRHYQSTSEQGATSEQDAVPPRERYERMLARIERLRRAAEAQGSAIDLTAVETARAEAEAALADPAAPARARAALAALEPAIVAAQRALAGGAR